MKRRYRLWGRNRFARIQRQGQRWVHPLVVLGGLPNDLGLTRCGFVVSRRAGRAVERNRIRRRLREAVRLHYQRICPGWDLVFIARPSMGQADFRQVGVALEELLRQAGLWQPQKESGDA